MVGGQHLLRQVLAEAVVGVVEVELAHDFGHLQPGVGFQLRVSTAFWYSYKILGTCSHAQGNFRFGAAA